MEHYMIVAILFAVVFATRNFGMVEVQRVIDEIPQRILVERTPAQAGKKDVRVCIDPLTGVVTQILIDPGLKYVSKRDFARIKGLVK